MKLFPPPLEDYEDYGYPSPSLWMALSVFELLRDVKVEDSPWKDIERRYHVTYYNLGPYAASLYLFTETCRLITRLFATYRNAEETEDTDLVVPSTSPEEIPSELFDIADVLVDFQPYFAHIDDPLSPPIKLSLGWCTPKVRSLVEVLQGHITPTFQGIIFVEQRQIASTLSGILPLIPELAGFVKCGILVGTNTSGPKEIGSDTQAQVVSAFRKREINLSECCAIPCGFLFIISLKLLLHLLLKKGWTFQ
jgi:endoribonuclease Dicer